MTFTMADKKQLQPRIQKVQEELMIFSLEVTIFVKQNKTF